MYVIQLRHALNLAKFHIVPFLIAVAFVLVNSHSCIWLLGDVCNNKRLCRLTIMVSNNVLITKVDKCIPEESKCFRENEADFILTTEQVDIN